MNTQALFCLSLPLVMIAGCAQQTSLSPARDSAFAQSQRPPVFSDIYQRSPEVTRSGRYTLVNVKSADAQREPLNQLIDITMPGQLVNSVGDGFRYLLFQSGYSLCGRYGADFAELLNRPLPAVQRRIGPMRLSEALQVVAGPAWRMSVDEVNREVCFVLRDAYLTQAKARTPTSVTPPTAVTPAVAGPVRDGVYSSPETSRNPYTGALPGKTPEPVVAGHVLATKNSREQAAGQSLPVPALKPPAAAVKSVGGAVSATSTAPRNPFTGENLTGTTMPAPASPSPVGAKPDVKTPSPAVVATPSTATTVQPATATVAAAKPLTGTPIPAVASGPEWKAIAGSTLKESLTDWASKADCTNGGHWVVIWQTSTDYRIDAPLVFKGNFESALVQVFDLYKKADKPLFAEASRLQCLVSVADKPADRS
ncbi:TcpQ domain-containing protein [Salmonella enterica]|nr:TcpQ domain-containing protein [Salmonella enterica]